MLKTDLSRVEKEIEAKLEKLRKEFENLPPNHAEEFIKEYIRAKERR